MKVASLAAAAAKSRFEFEIVHTGQHYHPELSRLISEDLGMPEPHYNLGVGKATAPTQMAEIMTGFERYLTLKRAGCVVVVGDVNSTLACALVAKKMGLPLAHVEAGLESGDRSMPEELNRLATDVLADFLFCTTPAAAENLRRRGRSEGSIYVVGDTSIDTLIASLPRARRPGFLDGFDERYAVCTLHRPSNVDRPQSLSRLLNAISDSTEIPVIFPVHPRTSENLGRRSFANIHFQPPLRYLEFLHLVRGACFVLTDSGGLQEEASFLNVPCLTLRDSTERLETLELGINMLVGTDPEKVREAIRVDRFGLKRRTDTHPRWDGRAGVRILDLLSKLL